MFQKRVGTVISGKKIGRTIGFPTANMHIKKWAMPDGTYKINIIVHKKKYTGIWSYKEKLELLEVHIFDFCENIYWQEVEIIPIYFIRENQEFTDIQDLQRQIYKDKMVAEQQNINVLTFGTFDHVHEGHNYYLWEASKYWDTLITIVATDKNVEKFKWEPPAKNYLERIQDVETLANSQIVTLGKERNTLYWLEKYKPKAICLWYDQEWFSTRLRDKIKNNNFDIKIIRVWWHKIEKYKSSLIKKKLS